MKRGLLAILLVAILGLVTTVGVGWLCAALELLLRQPAYAELELQLMRGSAMRRENGWRYEETRHVGIIARNA